MNEQNDTIICFSIPQSKFLLKQSYNLEMCNELRTLDRAEINIKDSLIFNYQNQQIEYEHQQTLSNNIDSLNVLKQAALKEQLNVCNKKYVKEKRAKLSALFLGIVSTTIITTLYIIK